MPFLSAAILYIFPSFPFFFVPGLYIVADTEGDGLVFLSDLYLTLFRLALFRLAPCFGSLLVKALTIFLILAAFFFASLLVFSGE